MKKKILLTVGILFLLAGFVFLLFFVKDFKTSKPQELSITDVTVNKPRESLYEKEEYVSPVDFDKLEKQYPDIVAWIEVDGPEISYPVFCNSEDDSFYIDHDRNKNASKAGEIFIEHNYNNSDFTDPLTVIYGHNMKNETMFGPLQNYFSYSGNNDINGKITVYTKKAEFHYEVFSATTFDNRHILFNYDFEDSYASKTFFEEVKNTRSLDTYFNEEVYNECGDIIVLSTCNNNNRNNRFLVIAGEVK